eukprot:scaffold3055_cov402-Prasinococcus_capsulatus_cf.AAC.6
MGFGLPPESNGRAPRCRRDVQIVVLPKRCDVGTTNEVWYLLQTPPDILHLPWHLLHPTPQRQRPSDSARSVPAVQLPRQARRGL